jgi:Ser/Thr protein kinase RdoA (MazF antagonist)
MDQKIRNRYHDGILQKARQCYAIAPDQIQSLHAFESFIYEFACADGAYILRLSHTLCKSEALIRREVNWINYLAAGGVGVARVIHSVNDQLVETINDGQGSHFLATAFIKAWGQSPWDSWTPTIGRPLPRSL